MASPGAIAKRRDAAINAILAEAERLAEALTVEPPDLPRRGRDPSFLMAQQLEAVATWLAYVADGASELAERPEPATKGKGKPKKSKGEAL